LLQKNTLFLGRLSMNSSESLFRSTFFSSFSSC
jgi:hypothetical protein